MLVTVVGVGLHLVFMTHAAALWRDEVNSLQFALMPSLSSVYASLQFDSVPLLSTLVLRGWVKAGWGATDYGLRVFGFVVGVGLLGMLWLTSWFLRRSPPLLSVALLGLNPLVIRYGDSIRPYGLGTFLVLLTLGLVWRTVQAATPWRISVATLAAILSVQCLYQNAFLLLAICLAGGLVALRGGMPKAAAWIGFSGLAAAVSLLPYWPSIRSARSWSVVIQGPWDFRQLWSVLTKALDAGGVLSAWVWIGLFLGCSVAGIWVQRRGSAAGVGTTERCVALFSVAVMVVASTGFLLFLWTARLPTQPWYHLPLMTVVAVCLDATVGTWTTSGARRIARLVLVLCVAGAAVLPASRGVYARQTNVDTVASLLERQAAKGDVIVVNPWYYGISFQRYYRGDAAWMTLPPLEDLTIHRYDLLKTRMTLQNPIGPLLEAIAGALKSGHRVWLVGGLPSPRSGHLPPSLPPAPHAIWGWSNGPYVRAWALQAGYFLQMHALQREVVPVAVNGPINRYENLPVLVVRGWR